MIVSRSTITVGDRFELEIEAVYDGETIVQMPGPNTKLDPFEILSHRYDTPIEDNEGHIVARSYFTLTAFSTGQFEIPALDFRYRGIESEQEETLKTEPVTITVESVLTAESDDIRDIKAPMEIPRDWLRLILALVTGSLVALAILILWRKRKKLSEKESTQVSPVLPPHIAAYRALNRLSDSDLLDRGEVVRYHVEVSEIIRRYFAGRFDVDALEMTSQDLLASLPREVPLSLPQELLRQCDLVKFAKFEPSRTESERVLQLAYEIIEITKPRPPEPPDMNRKPGPSRIEVGHAEVN